MENNKLWLLRPQENLPFDANPWDPWYDKDFGFVICAETEAEARAIAQANGGAERFGESLPWKLSEFSSCVELTATREKGVIMNDFARA